MRPVPWHPPVELSPAEQTIVKRIRRAKLFVFLRERRHELFDAAFQEELGRLYEDRRRGQPPVPPAQLALATVLQAYVGCSDDEVIEATTMDRRWQLVLDCLDASRPPFSKGTLVAFRERLIKQDADRRLIERTVALADQRGGFGSRALRAALDSSPLWGCGRVEDTYNLMGHALRKALGVVARQQGRGLADVAAEAGAPILGGTSLKAALDLDWDDPAERPRALVAVLDALSAVDRYLDQSAEAGEEPAASQEALAVARQVHAQDIERAADGPPTLRRGVARDRRISIEDAEMRHGRKSRSHRVDGFKRHVLRDLDAALIRAVGITPANVPEAEVTEAIIRRPRPTTGPPRRTAHRPRLPQQYPGPRAAGRPRHLLQGLAGPEWRPLPEDRVHARLGAADDPLPERRQPPLRAGRDRPLPGRDLCRLPAPRPLHHQRPRPRRRDPSRRAPPDRAPLAAGDARRPRQAPRAGRRRARPRPRRPLAGPPRTLSRRPQEPLRPPPLRRRPQPPRPRPPTSVERSVTT